MKAMLNKKQLIQIGVAVILLLSLISTGIYLTENKSLTKGLNEEKLKHELLLAEKVSLDKEIANMRAQINALQGTNSELDKVLAETSARLNEKEAELKKINRENGSIKSLRKKNEELAKIKSDLEAQIPGLQSAISKLNSEKDALNQTIARLTEENKQLNDNLNNFVIVDNYLIETTKGKNKLTVKAKRANKIAMSFKVPNTQVSNISFRITKPDGTQVKGNENGLAYNVVNDDENLLASMTLDNIKVSKKIEMTYTPKEKLKAGIYKIEIYNGDKNVGSCNIKLR